MADIAADFNTAVYEAVRRIPEGHVTSYKHIAVLVDHPRHSRLVGQALKYLPPILAQPDHVNFVPWHRVISSQGVISARGSSEAVQRQARMLQAEGVEVTESRAGALEGGRVKLRDYGWFES